ncbi:MAG: OB-fold nucleic acid binding domain-containing protein [Cyanobacteriota bacterium]|jgi:DNA polymerase-3 subunit alpha
MAKLIRRRSLGLRPVYDLGLVENHNFLLANGTVAANCFNKSHSTAYAYVTYQTAYLKANYPVEYMAALLTASSDSQEKVERYRENCAKLGIDVAPPDINRSQKHFTPLGQSILFGLSAVRNLGEGAIDLILRARTDAGGAFESLAHFCLNVDLRVVNRRALETLIYCGAFDRLQSNRNQLIQDLDLIIAWAQKKAKDKETGQMTIFEMVSQAAAPETESGGEKFAEAPSAPAVADFSLQEKLQLEKEHLGFYVSEHPLKSLQKSARLLSPISLMDLENYKVRQKVSAVVILVAVKKIITKKGDPMAFITLEDASGQAEGVVFPDNFQRLGEQLLEGSQQMIWGKVDKRDDRVQLIVEDLEPVETVRMVMVNLTPQQALNPSFQTQLKSILQRQGADNGKAKMPVVAIVNDGPERHFIRFGENYWVNNPESALASLQEAGFTAYSQPLAAS